MVAKPALTGNFQFLNSHYITSRHNDLADITYLRQRPQPALLRASARTHILGRDVRQSCHPRRARTHSAARVPALVHGVLTAHGRRVRGRPKAAHQRHEPQQSEGFPLGSHLRVEHPGSHYLDFNLTF